MNDFTKRTWAEIDLGAIRNNYYRIRESLPYGCRFLGVVKADAYGHGSLACSFAAKFGGADYLGVAHINEGMLLRQYGMDLPILVLGPCTPADFAYFVEFQLTAAITDLRTAQLFDQFLQETGTTCRAHLAIDTGMNRYGFDAEDFDSIRTALHLKHIEFEGMFTHLATADMPGNPKTDVQIQRFSRLVDVLEAEGIRPPVCHCSSSAGTLTHPESHFDMVRPGLTLYGYNCMGPVPSPYPIRPVMKIKSTIRHIHIVKPGETVSYGGYWMAQQPTRIATIAIGYGDGYLRGEYNKGFVMIRGQICPILGRVCMDATMVDVSHIPDVQVGETVDVVNGELDFHISMESVADDHHTIPYELTSRVARRLYRKYFWKNRLVRWDYLKQEFGVQDYREYPLR